MTQLADTLEAQMDALINPWAAGVVAPLAAGPRASRVLADHMPEFLRHVIAALREPAPGSAPPASARAGAGGLVPVYGQGFPLEAVVREYGLLLHTSLDLIERTGVPVPLAELRQLVDLVTGAAADAAAEHARRQATAAEVSQDRESERLKKVLEQAPSIIGHVAGPRHVFSFANRRFTQVAGGRPLAGLPIAEAMPELGSQALVGILDRAYATGEPFTAREMPATLDRTGRGAMREGLFDLVCQPTRGAEGEVDGVFIQAVEVTEAVSARREAQRLKARLDEPPLTRGDGVVTTDAQGRIQLMNPAAERLTGWGAGEAIGQHIEQVFPLVDGASRQPLRSPFPPVLCGESAPSIDNQPFLARRDGARFAFAHSFAAVRGGAGEVVGAVLVFRDETEARQRDAELRTFRAVVEASSDFIAFGTPDGTLTHINPAGARLIGLPNQQAARALSIADFYPPDDRDPALAAMVPLVAAGRPFHHETALQHFGSGERIPVSQSVFTVNDARGRPVVMATIVRDRREQQRVEAEREALAAEREVLLTRVEASRRAAEAQHNQLSVLFQQAPVAITLLRGPRHVIEFANAHVCRVWRRTETEVVGRPLFEALPEIVGQGFEGMLAGVLATGVPYVGKELLVRMARADGGGLEDVYFDFVYQPVAGEDGRPESILVVANEVTESVLAHKASELADRSREAERAKLYALFMQTPTMIAVLRGPDHVFELVNPMYRSAIGGREIAGLPMRQGLPELAGQGVFELLDGIYASGEPQETSETRVMLDRASMGQSEECYFDVVYQPLRDGAGVVEGILLFAVDVTERVLSRRQIEQVARERAALLDDARAARAVAESAKRAMDDFLANVSHELRTPLNSMLGWTRMLREDQLPASQRPKALETIERNAAVQAQLIEDLLDVSRIVSGTMRLDTSALDLASVIEAAVDMVEPAAADRQLRLESFLSRDVCQVMGDGARIQQVVWNLLSNAIKFTPPGGRIAVRLAKTGAFAEITVTDTGRGMESAFLAHAFDRFRQAEGAETRSTGGLGLGLSIVKSIVEMHGGSIHAESQGAGLGASFVVRFPCSRPA